MTTLPVPISTPEITSLIIEDSGFLIVYLYDPVIRTTTIAIILCLVLLLLYLRKRKRTK